MASAATDKPLVNKVAQSGLITLDLEKFFPEGECVTFDVKDFLFQGMILKEKDFREAVKEHDWRQYEGKNVAVFCSADAIVPHWAYMLIAGNLQPFAKEVVFGNKETLEALLWRQMLHTHIDPAKYKGERVIVKGCGKKEIPAAAYLEAAKLLQPVVKSLMYGEACSTVPLFKNK